MIGGLSRKHGGIPGINLHGRWLRIGVMGGVCAPFGIARLTWARWI